MTVNSAKRSIWESADPVKESSMPTLKSLLLQLNLFMQSHTLVGIYAKAHHVRSAILSAHPGPFIIFVPLLPEYDSQHSAKTTHYWVLLFFNSPASHCFIPITSDYPPQHSLCNPASSLRIKMTKVRFIKFGQTSKFLRHLLTLNLHTMDRKIFWNGG